MNQDDIDQQNWDNGNVAPDFIGVTEMTAYLIGQGIPATSLAMFDDPYDPINPQWVQDNLITPWKDEIGRLKLRSIGYESQDCDDFARGCAWIAQVIKDRVNPGNAGAFFECSYNMIGYGEHAIVGCVWRLPDKTLQMAFFEPQPTMTNSGFVLEVLKSVTLSKDELQTITFIRF